MKLKRTKKSRPQNTKHVCVQRTRFLPWCHLDLPKKILKPYCELRRNDTRYPMITEEAGFPLTQKAPCLFLSNLAPTLRFAEANEGTRYGFCVLKRFLRIFLHKSIMHATVAKKKERANISLMHKVCAQINLLTLNLVLKMGGDLACAKL